MKVKNPSTGNFETVYVKALDSLPVGTEVDFDGTSADIPIGWEQVSGKSYVAYELYNNSTGSTDNITLSESSANFNYIEIYYKNADNEYDMTKVHSPNGKRASLKSLHYYDNVIYTYIKCLDISGNSLNKNSTYSGGGYYGGAMGVQNTDNIYITRVIGYKEV